MNECCKHNNKSACNISSKQSLRNFYTSKSLTGTLPVMRLKGWRAHRCILLLHVIFVLLLEIGSQIALRRNHTGWEEMEASDSDPTLGRETAAQQMCAHKGIIYSPKNKTKLIMMKHLSWFLVYTFRHKQTWLASHVCIDQVYLEVCLW